MVFPGTMLIFNTDLMASKFLFGAEKKFIAFVHHILRFFLDKTELVDTFKGCFPVSIQKNWHERH